MSVTEELDALIEELDQAVGDETGADATDGSTAAGAPDSATHASAADALDLILGAPPRRTNVKRLRDSDVVRQFREDLLNGTVRIDRLNQILSIVALIIKQVLKRL
jgi:hypothetical protein